MSSYVPTRSAACSAIVLAVGLASGAGTALAAPASGVIDALQKKYGVTETTPDREQVTKDGTTMAMKCAGVYTLPTNVMITPDNKVVDGKVQAPSMITRMTWTKFGSHVLQTGDKVYITKIESKNDGGNDMLRFSVLTVSAIDAAGQNGAQKKFDGVVSFKFKKGYLDEAPPDEVEQTVEAVLAPDTGDDKQAGDASSNGGQAAAAPQRAQAAAPPPAPAPVAPPPPPAPAGPPPTITIGESSTEVLQAMGMPAQMIDLGKKKTYVYKNMKIIFVNDKVSDVQ